MRNISTVQGDQNVEIYLNNELVRRVKNLVPNVGRYFIAERMITAIPAVMSHMSIGTDNSFGLNLVTNGDMELDVSWNNYGSPSSNIRSNAQYHNGSYSRSFVTAGGADDGIMSDVFTTVTDQDVFVEAWIYPTATTTCYVAVRQGDDDRFLYLKRWTGLTAGAWNKIDFSVVETAGGANSYIAFFSDVADTFYVDDVSVNLSTTLAATTLGAELSRLPLVSATRTNNYIQYSCDWAAGVGTGAIEEAGIFNDPVVGTMLSRICFPVINKLTLDSLSIIWRIYINSI